jgi:hypothetical protein
VVDYSHSKDMEDNMDNDKLDNVPNAPAKTDKQRTKEFLESLGVQFFEDEDENKKSKIRLESGTEKVVGYCDFCAKF